MFNRSISLIFEASHGCQLSCGGCTIDTKATSLPTQEQWDRLRVMFDGFTADGTPYAEFELGPTDLMSCDNRNELFTDPNLRNMVRRFKLFTLAASFIHPDESDYIDFAYQVHECAPDITVGLAIPVEFASVFNDKYIETMRKNIEVFRVALPNPLDEVVMTVIFDHRYLDQKIEGKKRTYEELFQRIQDLQLSHNTKVDFAFQHGRNNINDPLQAASFLRSFRMLNEQYVADLAKRNHTVARHIPFQLMFDTKGGELIYSKGDLYVRPVLNERVTIFHEYTKFRGPWTAENYYDEIFTRLNRNLDLAQGFDDCKQCLHMATCADRGIHDLMHLTHTRKCVTLLKNHDGIVRHTTHGDFEQIQWSMPEHLPT